MYRFTHLFTVKLIVFLLLCTSESCHG